MKIPVPKCDPEFDSACSGKQHLPYERIAYDKQTGQSPNIPRRQVGNKGSEYETYVLISHINACRCNEIKQCVLKLKL